MKLIISQVIFHNPNGILQQKMPMIPPKIGPTTESRHKPNGDEHHYSCADNFRDKTIPYIMGMIKGEETSKNKFRIGRLPKVRPINCDD